MLCNWLDGYYWICVLVNKKISVEFMIDIGVSVVVLIYKDVQKMGLNLDKLDYCWEIRIVGGNMMGVSVMIDMI